MSRKVIIVGHVGNHIGCSAELVEALSRQEGTVCSAVFPPEIPITNFDLRESVKNPVLCERVKESIKGYQIPYKYHR